MINRRHFLLTTISLIVCAQPLHAQIREHSGFFDKLFAGLTSSNRWRGKKYPGKQFVPFRTTEAPGTIVVKTRERTLYLVQPNSKAIAYGIGVGRSGFNWSGRAHIGRKSEWPAWHPPKDMIERELRQYGRELPERMEGGPDNPLGARALYLHVGEKDTLYRIHGTNAPGSIGQALSSGCIRMLNKEIIDLYDRVEIHTEVVVM